MGVRIGRPTACSHPMRCGALLGGGGRAADRSGSEAVYVIVLAREVEAYLRIHHMIRPHEVAGFATPLARATCKPRPTRQGQPSRAHACLRLLARDR
jgi:hypothetical protein